MRNAQISEIIGQINETYIDEATTYAGETKNIRRKGWIKWGAVAACFVCVFVVGMMMLLHKPEVSDDEKYGTYFLEDQAPIVVSVERWLDEGFIGKVMDTGNHEYLKKNSAVYIRFDTGTKVKTPEGGVFTYNEGSTMAWECGLPVGMTVKIAFNAVEYAADGMANEVSAKAVIPQS